jgi:hypothetical protein
VAAGRDLTEREDRGWVELIALAQSLAPEQAERPGYTPEGWSVKDLLAHVACWQALTVHVLQQIGCGTRRHERVDVDDVNSRFHALTHDLPLWVVRAMAWSARSCMLLAWSDLVTLSTPTAEAEEWFRESGPEHYDEHLPRLREWARQVEHAGPSS